MTDLYRKFKKTKYACFYTYLAMSSIFSLPPILFVTFHETYKISNTALGTLVLVNFCTQLLVDLIFTFFSKWFSIEKTIRIMPLLTTVGLLIYALIPSALPQYAYLGLLIGTVIFSVASGLCEVFLSPLVAAIPSEHPERDMSTLHSLYAYGVLGVVFISSAYLYFFGTENWMYLTVFFALLPVGSFIMFSTSELPKVNLTSEKTGDGTKNRAAGLAFCVGCISLGSASENAMTNWISSYMENALLLPKMAGDLLGMALFSVLLGLGRTWYAKRGKNIFNVLLFGMIGAAGCYLIAGLSTVSLLSMSACILTGLFTSMLWPGTLILMEEKFPSVGVAAYALMAAGGDFGGSVAPQLLGAVVDVVSESSMASEIGTLFSLSSEQVGMKAGMLLTALFPLMGIALLFYMKRFFKKQCDKSE